MFSLTHLANRFAAYRQIVRERNRIFSEMNRYTDRELAELGCARSDIRDIAKGTYKAR